MGENQTIIHEIQPVWDKNSKVLILGTMPSPKSREAGFFYMHPQNRFWRVLPAVFEETLSTLNNASEKEAAIEERKAFLLRHHVALWDVLASCDINGAADSSIRNAVPNDFHGIFGAAKIHRVYCTGKTAFAFWKRFCAAEYETSYDVKCECLPSTSPANASWTEERLLQEYMRVNCEEG